MTPHKRACTWITLAAGVYLFFSLTFLELPGLQYDEVNFANAALGRVEDSFIAWSYEVFGNRLPLMVMNYIGAVKSALYAPVFHFFGASANTARLPVVLIGMLTLLFSYALFRDMFNVRIAGAALMLFATDPTFIFANRLDWGPVSLMLAFEVSSLYFLWRWMSEGRRPNLVLSGFLMGLGLYNKIIFGWFIAALFISMALFYREKVRQLLSPRNLCCFLPPLLLGCLPLIAFNIAIPGGTFRGRPVMTARLSDSLAYHYRLFQITLDGSAIYQFVNQEEVANPAPVIQKASPEGISPLLKKLAGFQSIKNTWMSYALPGSLLLILVIAFIFGLREKRKILFLISQLLLIAGFICLTAEATGSHHVIAFYPFLFAVVAYAACELGWVLWKSGTVEIVIISACIACLVFPQLVVDARYLLSFEAKGGVGAWSDAIYELASFTHRHPEKTFVLMEWGFNTQLAFLSQGPMRKEEFVCSPDRLEICMEALVHREDVYYVFHLPPFESPSRFPAFNKVLVRFGMRGRTIQTFYQRDGRPIYIVYEIFRPGMEADASRNEHGTDKECTTQEANRRDRAFHPRHERWFLQPVSQ